MVTWSAFVQIIYLVSNEKNVSFSTIFKTIETCFQILLGKFDADVFIGQNTIIGSIAFAFYNIFVVIVLMLK